MAYPILINLILEFIEELQEGKISTYEVWYKRYRGYWLAALLFIAMAAKALTESIYFFMVYRAGYHTRVAISVSVYNKALRLGSAERNSVTTGELINLMQVDASKIELFFPQIHVLWDGLVQIAGYMVILYFLIGWSSLAGFLLMVLSGPLQGKVMGKLFGYNHSMVKYTDERVKVTNEAVQGIRCVKMYTWEESFQQVIDNTRVKELNLLKKIAYLRGASRAYMNALPGLVAVSSFAVYALISEGDIRASTLFAALAAFSQLRFPLLFYPSALAQYAQAAVCVNRVENFLCLAEVSRRASNEIEYDEAGISFEEGLIRLTDVNVFWNDPANQRKSNKEKILDTEKIDESHIESGPILRDLTMSVNPGELCAIIGRVGSGKSTLCSAILNEAVTTGSVVMNGSIAYASQSPFILNATLRENITFGKPYEEERYQKVITACQLTHDIALLDSGDLTEIGEKGINLSGGQKQRVSIARAAYSEAKIIILDDPLSALDPEVGQKLFHECIVQLMAKKTRIFVANQLQFLQHCDSIVALGNGQIIEQGSYFDLMKDTGEVQNLLKDLEAIDKADDDKSSPKSRSSENKAGDSREDVVKKKDKLVSEEERRMGAVPWRIYKQYFLASGGFVIFSLSVAMYVLYIVVDLTFSSWVAVWTSDAEYENQSRSFYLGIYALLSICVGVVTFLRSYFLALLGVTASKNLHNNLLRSVLRAPMSFFDTTPTGRILSRFSNDMYSIDLELSEYIDFVLMCSLTVIASFGLIIFVTPWFGVALIPVLYIYIKAMNYFRLVSRETKRLDSISRSPVYAHFSETLGGLGTIRAYSEVDRFINDFETKVDCYTRAYYNNKVADRWLTTRLDFLGAIIAGLAAAFAVNVAIAGSESATSSSSSFASTAGLSLVYATSMTGLLNWTVRCFAQMEAGMNATERILYYTEEITHEAPSKTKDLKQIFDKKFDANENDRPPNYSAIMCKGVETISSNWPSRGKITINNLNMRYRPETPFVIKGLSFEIEGGSRIGVVGRTGSGKSSLLLSLLRIVEPFFPEDATYEVAPITIDDIDVFRIGLTDLRSKIGIIPQSPVLFSGSVRSNMDPFNDFTDEVIWRALEGCGMKNTILNMEGLLDAPIAEYGQNLSQGQRQLLCLGRALLKRCCILLLDEATSSVDMETDKEIQRTLREAFADCTVLTIAHRVNTIMDSDKILVMKDGRLEEFDTPENLLADKNSSFANIVRQS